MDLSWLELLPPRRLRPLCEQKGLSVGGNSEALAKRLRASGGLSGGQLKELCGAPEVGVASYGTKVEIARRIGAKLAPAATEEGQEEEAEAPPPPAELDLSWLELLPPRRLKPLCEQKGLSVGGNSEALAKRLRASGGLGGEQLKGLCDAPEVGVASYGTKVEIARRIGAKLAPAATEEEEEEAAEAEAEAEAAEETGAEAAGKRPIRDEAGCASVKRPKAAAAAEAEARPLKEDAVGGASSSAALSSFFCGTSKYEEKLKLWRELGGGDLERVLASGAVAFLDAQWIISHAEAGGVLNHRQALPEKAFLSLADLVEATSGFNAGSLPVAALSYPWLTKDHPDPLGANLARVARALKALLSFDFDRGEYIIPRLGVFWDFGSLYQHPDPPNGVMRTEEQNALFKQGLGCLGTLYSHPRTIVLRLTSFPDGHKAEDQSEGTNVAKYVDRGWCATESAWASLAKDGYLSLDLGLMRDGKEYCFDSLLDDCVQGGGRRPPLLPSAFAAELESKSFTNGKDDKPLVKRLYETAFKEQFGKATELFYARLDWGDAEAAQLAEVLASGAVPGLKGLYLYSNKIGDEGCKALAAAFKEGAARLEELDLLHNQIGDEGCKALAAALKMGAAPSLKYLVVDNKQPELVAVCKKRGISTRSTDKRRQGKAGLFVVRPYVREEGAFDFTSKEVRL